MAQTQWNKTNLFPDRAAWQADLDLVRDLVDGLTSAAGTFASGGPDALAAFLDRWQETGRRVSVLYFYAFMEQSVDNRDPGAQALVGQAGSLWGRFEGAASFIKPELLALGHDRLKAWMDQSPALKVYDHFLENLFRQQAHVRSPEVEEVLGLASEIFQGIDSIHDMLVDSDLKFAPAGSREVTQGTVEKLAADPDRQVRRQAWESYCDAHLGLENTLAAALNASVKADVFRTRARRFDTTLDRALFQDNLPPAAYHRTLETFQAHLPVWHRYWRARRKALGVNRLAHYDIWAPLGKKPPVVGFEQAVDWISQAVAPLGTKYVETLRRGCLEEGWIDLLPTPGKGSGAFSGGAPGTHPFIFMSWADDLSSLSTLTHELGHSMHSWHTWKHQPMVYADYSIFAAEVASNCHQALTRAHLFETQKDPEFQLALIEEAMENFHRYFFIMPTLARFEAEHHRRIEAGQGVSAQDLGNLMADLFTEGYGGEVEVDRRREGITWAQFSHLYADYYVFQYATGISAAHALAAPLRAGTPGAAEGYLEFLSAGSRLYPVDALKRAGVDMTTGEAVERAFEVLEGLVARLETLVG